MLEKMIEIGSNCLKDINPEYATDALFGFHRPPINSIDHLHMHAVAMPISGFFASIAYGKRAPFLIPAETVISNLKSMKRISSSDSEAISDAAREKVYLYKVCKK